MYPGVNESLISKGLSAIKGLKFSSILEGTEKTLGVINQAIPIIYQVKPLVSNVKTLFKISSIMNDDSSSSNNSKTDTNSNNSPIFYI